MQKKKQLCWASAAACCRQSWPKDLAQQVMVIHQSSSSQWDTASDIHRIASPCFVRRESRQFLLHHCRWNKWQQLYWTVELLLTTCEWWLWDVQRTCRITSSCSADLGQWDEIDADTRELWANEGPKDCQHTESRRYPGQASHSNVDAQRPSCIHIRSMAKNPLDNGCATRLQQGRCSALHASCLTASDLVRFCWLWQLEGRRIQNKTAWKERWSSPDYVVTREPADRGQSRWLPVMNGPWPVIPPFP